MSESESNTADTPAADTLGTFDYVIVGAGPSAIGLLFGLLQSENQHRRSDDPGTQKLTIALIERGADTNDTTKVDPLIRPLHRWCAASHPSWINHPKPTSTRSPRKTNAVVYQGRMNTASASGDGAAAAAATVGSIYRVMDVSTGSGLGGSTLINAGLVIPPSSLDFQEWPTNISNTIMDSVATIVHTMHANQCVVPSYVHSDGSGAAVASSSSLSPLPGVPKPPWIETKFPSCCLHVPCSARIPHDDRHDTSTRTTGTAQRVSYYESLLQPLFDRQRREQQQQRRDSNATDVSVLTGYNAERLYITKGKNSTESAVCTGLEVMNLVTGVYMSIYATTNVILCTGTVQSPVLLLAAGIGLPHTLPTTTVVSEDDRYENQHHHHHHHPYGSVVSDEAAKAPVGYNLKDHILLPRIMLTRPDWSVPALNGVRAIANIILEPTSTTESLAAGVESDTAATVLSSSVSTWSSSPNEAVPDHHSFATKVQVSVMDSAAYTDLVPLMVASALRFRCDDVDFVNTCGDILFQSIQLLLHILIVYTPVYYLLRYCTKVMAVFVMNAQSVGSITVSRKIPSPPQSSVPSDPMSTTTTTKNCTSSSSSICRVSDLNIHIHLGYLSNTVDIQRFMKAFEASYDMYNPNIGALELFPGPFVRQHYGLWKDSSTFLHPGRFAMFAHAMVRPYFHWIGTCSMKKKNTIPAANTTTTASRSGKKTTTTRENQLQQQQGTTVEDTNDWVVDEHFRVRGVHNLRVCDASIFPTLISAPTALTCAALGHVLASILLEELKK
jgi:choline dehydrogenase-like flavoprotein